MITVNQYFEILSSTFGAYNNFAKREGINYSTLAIFDYLYNNQKATARDISYNWGIPKQTLHSSIKDLEKKELITFEENPQDKRSKLIILTKSGKEIANPIIEKLNTKEQRALLTLTEEERNTLVKLTKRFAKSITKEVNNG